MRAVILIALVAGCTSPGGPWPAATVPAFVHQARFAVTDNLSDELSYVDPQKPMLLGHVPVGDNPVELEGPHHLAASPDGKFIYYNLSNYVPGTGSGPHGSHGTGSVPGSLVKLDARTQEKIAEVLVDRSPGDVILSKDGRHAFVSHYNLLRLQVALATGAPIETGYSAVAVVDTASMTRTALVPVCPTAHGEGLSPDERTLYVTCYASDELAAVDVSDTAHPTVTTRTVIGNLKGSYDAPAYGPYALRVSPTDGRIWVSNNRSGDVRVFDSALTPGGRVAVDGLAMFADFSTDGRTLYVATQTYDALHAIDTQTLASRPLPLPAEACLNGHAFVLGPDGVHGLVVCEGDHVRRPGSIVYVNTTAFSVDGFVNVGMFSDGAAYLPALP